MKRTCNSSLDFKKKNVSEKVTLGSTIIGCLGPDPDGNESNFPDLPVSLKDLTDVNTRMQQTASKANLGSKEASDKLKEIIQEWNSKFAKTAMYVSLVAFGNPAVIRSAGFEPTKNETNPATAPGVGKNFNATINGSKGTIVANCSKGVPQAKYYAFSILPEGASISYNDNVMGITINGVTAYLAISTTAEAKLYNLPSSKLYSVSMIAGNSAGCGSATAPKEVTTQ